ncbi:MFS transporter [Pullulanibacillus camelliae]|uniref:Putative proline/betaine transporter n=1 Tax=Pullulanibacillus camelliae TaxID=1707096 RepID=A0A8J2YIC5_9BACL|nr:MFS transporter [Pullulanibacillus camelliae]GGE45071.1 MFS transporter [Pullulanibacillus camelliae]
MEKSTRKAIAAGSIGNAMEFYDWGIYGYFAAVISEKFFPPGNDFVALLSTFAVFAVGFFMRPIGSLFFGPLGDRFGRQKVLSLSVILMGIGTLLIGILPTYHQIGVLAPILLVVARLIQGFSAGAEWGSSTSFLVEYAPQNRRGFYGSFQQFSTIGGMLLSSLIATLFVTILSDKALNAWGWRIPFIIGIIIGIIGLYMRSQVKETPKFRETLSEGKDSKSPLLEILKHPKGIFVAIGFTISWTVCYYVLLTYMPTYIKEVMDLSYADGLVSNLIVLIFLMIFIPITGLLSDRFGRRPLLLISCGGLAVFSYPLFLLIGSSFLSILLPQLLLAIFIVCFAGPGPAALAEVFPTRVRNSSLSIGYNIGVALFGGTAPFIATALVQWTDNKISPTFYVIICGIITFFVILGMKEKANAEID